MEEHGAMKHLGIETSTGTIVLSDPVVHQTPPPPAAIPTPPRRMMETEVEQGDIKVRVTYPYVPNEQPETTVARILRACAAMLEQWETP
jgi:hypothetical protein